MDTEHREHTVIVWGEPHIVTVNRKSETVYEAIGNYMCETICVNDQSEGAAIKRWREVAAGVSTYSTAHARCLLFLYSSSALRSAASSSASNFLMFSRSAGSVMVLSIS